MTQGWSPHSGTVWEHPLAPNQLPAPSSARAGPLGEAQEGEEGTSMSPTALCQRELRSSDVVKTWFLLTRSRANVIEQKSHPGAATLRSHTERSCLNSCGSRARQGLGPRHWAGTLSCDPREAQPGSQPSAGCSDPSSPCPTAGTRALPPAREEGKALAGSWNALRSAQPEQLCQTRRDFPRAGGAGRGCEFLRRGRGC